MLESTRCGLHQNVSIYPPALQPNSVVAGSSPVYRRWRRQCQDGETGSKSEKTPRPGWSPENLGAATPAGAESTETSRSSLRFTLSTLPTGEFAEKQRGKATPWELVVFCDDGV
ncbi:hypothetical protein POX_d05372 [Penicillium oxalicum]|uniref:hypothetical protein n=1 Tax=Penicillium oxalicum TaxID=69781 RepID=UPI0020B83A02|nr:hypothetical protein POX_d05372 [Penicillium oxalicum]KAI2789873.1 hypothetical protein POX_d05372 [Penicillium oxalicum]